MPLLMISFDDLVGWARKPGSPGSYSASQDAEMALEMAQMIIITTISSWTK